MTKPIGVGIVGANPDRSWAAAAHLPALAQLPEFAVTAVATTRRDTADRAARSVGARHAFVDATRLAEHADVDLVVVSVKAPAHAQVIRAALAAGKHVLSEWPLGVDADEADELARSAAAGTVAAVCLQGWYSPSAHLVHDLLASGIIGSLTSVSMVAAGDPLGGTVIPAPYAWSVDPAAGNTLVTITAGHALAVLDRIAGPLADVSARTLNLHDMVRVAGSERLVANGAAGQLALHGRLQAGALLSLSVHGGRAGEPDGFLIKLAGTDGTLTVTPVRPQEYPGWAEWQVRTRDADGTTTEHVVPDRYRIAPPTVPSGPAANVAALYLDLAGAIRENHTTATDFDYARRHHRLLAVVEESARTGNTLALN